MILSLIIGFVLGAVAIIFAFQNTMVVALSFLGYQFQSSLALIVMLSLLIGALISLLLSLPAAVSDRFQIYGLRRENRKLSEALDNANNQPRITRRIVLEEPATV